MDIFDPLFLLCLMYYNVVCASDRMVYVVAFPEVSFGESPLSILVRVMTLYDEMHVTPKQRDLPQLPPPLKSPDKLA